MAITDDVEVHARYAVLAVPPNLSSRIAVEPPIPRRQQIAHQHISLGMVIKVHAVYETPFWREEGLSGTGFGGGRLVQEVYDNTNRGDAPLRPRQRPLQLAGLRHLGVRRLRNSGYFRGETLPITDSTRPIPLVRPDGDGPAA